MAKRNANGENDARGTIWALLLEVDFGKAGGTDRSVCPILFQTVVAEGLNVRDGFQFRKSIKN
jgi:hypothetical protein